MSKKFLFLCLVAVLTACVTPSATLATEVILNPAIDTWLHEDYPDATRENDLISVWTPNAGEGWRDGLVSFDVSGISEPIVSARLELYARDYWRHSTAHRQNASLVIPDLTTGEVSWNQFVAGYSTTPLETFGRYDIPADSPVEQFYSCAGASAADITDLNAQMNATGTLSFALKAETWVETVTGLNGRREWADKELYQDPTAGSVPPLLLINGTTPVTVSVDTWIRELDGGSYENDLVSVWHDEGGENTGQRFGILEFDLSSISTPITSAKTVLWATGSGHNVEAFEQDAFVLDTDVATGSIDWATYHSAAVTETALDSLGHYLFARDAEMDIYHESDAASSIDIAALEALRLAGDKLVIALKSVPQEVEYEREMGGQRDWNDTGYTSANPETWARLIINEDVVERTPGDANEDGYVDVTDLGILATNYGATGPWEWGDGDFDGDTIVNVNDLGILATWYGTTPPQSVPEPSTFAGLLGLCLAGLLAWSRRRSS